MTLLGINSSVYCLVRFSMQTSRGIFRSRLQGNVSVLYNGIDVKIRSATKFMTLVVM